MDITPTTGPPPQQTLYCIHCGYNLHTLNIDALCPECGQPVAPSFSGDWLFFSDRRWLRKLYWACIIALWIGLADWVIQALFLMDQWITSRSKPLIYCILASMVAEVFLDSGNVVCLWLLTSAEPLRDQSKNLRSLRISMRALSIALLTLTVPSVIMYARMMLAPIWVTETEHSLDLWLHAIACFAGAVNLALLGFYRSALARRIPDRLLLRNSWIAAIGLASISVLRTVFWTGFATGLLRMRSPKFYEILSISIHGWATCDLLFFTISLFVLRRFARHFKRLSAM